MEREEEPKIYRVRVTEKRSAYLTAKGEVIPSISYSVAIPKPIASKYGIKGREDLYVTLTEAEIEGKRVKGIFYFRRQD